MSPLEIYSCNFYAQMQACAEQQFYETIQWQYNPIEKRSANFLFASPIRRRLHFHYFISCFIESEFESDHSYGVMIMSLWMLFWWSMCKQYRNGHWKKTWRVSVRCSRGVDAFVCASLYQRVSGLICFLDGENHLNHLHNNSFGWFGADSFRWVYQDPNTMWMVNT